MYWECLIKVYRWSDLVPYFAYVSNEGSGEPVRVCMLVWAFANIMDASVRIHFHK